VLHVGETVSVDDAELSIRFVRVSEDSRCPIDADCIWAGNGQVEIEVRRDGELNTFRLNTMEGAKEVGLESYRIQLVQLAPVPSAGQPIPAETYRATLRVTRTGTACTEEARPALVVSLTDSITGAVTGFTDVVIVARDGEYTDAVELPAYPGAPFNGPVSLAYERRGTYAVSVSAAGYAMWTKTGVVVTGDQCHVASVGVTARLVR
jgi:hypothetical protein